MNNIIGVSRWDNAAGKLKHWMGNDDYFEQFVKKIKIRPSWTVLDIGCGPGDISIWAAKRAKHVTSLDHSGKMLHFLKEHISAEGLHNISCVQCPWDNEKADEIEMHDVVIASRSIGSMVNKKEVLHRIDNHARRYVYITIGIKIETPITQSIQKILGNEKGKSSRFISVYNYLYKTGIRAKVDYIYGRSKFRDINDVIEQRVWARKKLTPLQEKLLFNLFSENMIKRKDGLISFPYDDLCWALISWQKPAGSKYYSLK
jgi:ubiquinone/menaquinone biosynthesis C-methylase UbiE